MNDDTIPLSESSMSKPATKGWPPERRAAQAARIRETKPWLKSTGPKTAAGKRRCSQNARKHGRRSAIDLQILQALRVQHLSLLAHDEFMRLAASVLHPAPGRPSVRYEQTVKLIVQKQEVRKNKKLAENGVKEIFSGQSAVIG